MSTTTQELSLIHIGHIPRAEMELFSRLRIDPGDYQKPAAESIQDKLTAEQYRVTQESGTERAFTDEFWDKFEKGLYVDAVSYTHLRTHYSAQSIENA